MRLERLADLVPVKKCLGWLGLVLPRLALSLLLLAGWAVRAGEGGGGGGGTSGDTPSINFFYASTTNITLGQSVALSWQTREATRCSISQGIGYVAASGSIVVSPSATTTYTLAASNSNGNTYAYITVTVWVPPAISAFTASPATIFQGSSSSLAWSVSGASVTFNISPGVGNVTGSNVTVSPGSTTTYTLTASNPGGSVSRQCTVAVNPPPSIASLTATPGTVNLGQSATLAWSVSGAGYSLSLAPGIGPVTGSSLVVQPTSTTTYTLTATNGAGSVTSSAKVTVNLPPSFGTMPNPSIAVDTPSSFTLPAGTDHNGLALTYQLTGLPQGLSFNPATLMVSGTAPAVGNYPLKFTATDSLGLSTSTTILLTVTTRAISQVAFTQIVQYTYDANGRLSTITYPSSNVVTYTYDAFDRPVQVSVNGSNVVSLIQYDGWSNQVYLGFPSPSADQWVYDASGTLLKQWVVETNGAMPQTWNYAYDSADRLIQAGEWTTLGYDLNNRLTSAVGFGFSSTLAYDAFGNNISSVSSGEVPNAMNNFTFSPEPGNQLPSFGTNGGTSDVLEDPYGEITTVATGISTHQDLGLSWDDLGRLAAATRPPQTVQASPAMEYYSYAANGYRVARTDSLDPSWNRIYAYNSSGLLLTEFLGSPSGPIWNRDVIYVGNQAVAEIDDSGALHELHGDYQGTPRVISSSADPSGQVNGLQGFGPFGELIQQAGYFPLTGWTGHLQTEPNGFIYMKGRFYSPVWHIFMNSNQGADPHQLNQFAYCGGNPLMSMDPAGLDVMGPNGTSGPEPGFGRCLPAGGAYISGNSSGGSVNLSSIGDGLSRISALAADGAAIASGAIKSALNGISNFSGLASIGIDVKSAVTNPNTNTITTIGLDGVGLAISKMNPGAGLAFGMLSSYAPGALSGLLKDFMMIPDAVAALPATLSAMEGDLSSATNFNPNSPNSFSSSDPIPGQTQSPDPGPGPDQGQTQSPDPGPGPDPDSGSDQGSGN